MKRANGTVGFVMRCPKCGAQLQVPSDRLGVKVRCPSCQVVIPVAANLAESARLRRLAPQRGAGLLRSAKPAAAASDGQGMSLRRVLALIGLLCFVLFVIVTGVLLLALPRAEEPVSSDVQTGAAGNASGELIALLEGDARPSVPQKQPPAAVQVERHPDVGLKRAGQGLRAADLIVDGGRIRPAPQDVAGAGARDDPALATQEPPKTREEIISDLKQSLESKLAKIRMEEEARFQASIPALTYCDKFSAVMRNQDGVDLASNIWDLPYAQARYPGSGQASRALNELKRLRPVVQAWERELASVAQEIRNLENQYQQEHTALRNQIVRDAARSASASSRRQAGGGRTSSSSGSTSGSGKTSRSGAKGVSPQWAAGRSNDSLVRLRRRYEARIAPLNSQASDIQGKINAAYAQLRYWENTETNLRRGEKYAVLKLEQERDTRTDARVRELLKAPEYAFIARYNSLEEDAAKNRRVAKMLEEAEHPDKAAEALKRAEELEADLTELVNEYFGPEPPED